jgi:hypothetical protein
MVHATAMPNVVNNTEATVASRKAPTKSVKTDAQVAAPPIAPEPPGLYEQQSQAMRQD